MECICWGNGDSYVAAGTRKGNVFLYNQLTKQTFAAFTMKQGNKLGSISSIKWSPHKELIATTSNDGLLSLWNYRLKELIISIHSHKAPATDLAFSPHHDAFLVSSGMDGSLCCFDVIQQKILSTISIYAPLTSVDFHPNGSLVAVGTMGQNAAIYDLRDPKNKLAHLVNSDHGNVYSLKFETGQTTTTTTNPQRPTTLTQETNKGLSTFAQQTTRSRHTSSSSSTSTPTTTTDNSKLFLTQPRTSKSRERTISSTKTNTSSTTIDSSSSSPRQQRNDHHEQTSNSSLPNSNDCMSFEDFAQLCGVSTPSPMSNGHNRIIPNNEIDESLKTMLDNRVNCLREDFKDDLNRTKLSMQMNFIVELERLRTDLMKQIETNSLNAQLIDEIERLRAENKRLRQLQPRL
jgi:WD40 repeat protein